MAYHDHDRPAQYRRVLDDASPPDDANPTTVPSNETPAAPSYLHSSISGLAAGFGGLVRRFSDMTAVHNPHPLTSRTYSGPPLAQGQGNGASGVFMPPMHHYRSVSPMRPPPLEPLELKGFRDDTTGSARLLTPAVAEEIRTLIPERQRLEDEWNLVYSLDQDGASLGTLYQKSNYYEGQRASFVLVVRDNEGGLFGAYLSDPPRPQPHYFGNGECFLWRASLLASLPPPPSEDTTNYTAARVTTIVSPTRSSFPRAPEPVQPTAAARSQPVQEDLLIDLSDGPPVAAATNQPASHLRPSSTPTPPPRSRTHSPALAPPPNFPPPFPRPTHTPSPTRASANEISRTASPAPSTGPSIRFKAFPYSGENEFYIYCEQHYLSVGGGDGHYGLWLNDSLEKGISSRCLTFGNEPLSDEGVKFGVLGVELWLIGTGGGVR